MNSMFHTVRGKGRSTDAFTLVELFVVLGVLALLVATLLPAMAAGRADSQSFQCYNNLRQLQRGWLMYTDDNSDKIPQNIASNSPRFTTNPYDPNAQPGMPNASWVLGYVNSPPAWTNDLLITHGLIYPYLKSTAVFKCPQDATVRNRSYSMNCWMDGIGAWNGYGIDYTKMSEFNVVMPPAMAFVFIEENPASINDGYFVANPANPTVWVDVPASYHDGASGLSFADGHVTIRRWSDRVVLDGLFAGPGGVPQDPSSTDLQWLLARSTVLQGR